MTVRHGLIIGAQRSGSTLLASLLDRHPEIAIARPLRPEPKVFLGDDVVADGLDAYRNAWFGHRDAETLLLEKSTSYIEDPLVARRAHDLFGDHVAIAVLRDPVARAISNWRFSSDNGFETRPLVTALRAELDGTMPPWEPGRTSVSPFAYLQRGRFHDYLLPFTRAYGDRLHVVFLAELSTDPGALADLHRRLDLPPHPASETAVERVNASITDEPLLPADLAQELRAWFAAPDAALSDLLGRPLPWHEESNA